MAVLKIVTYGDEVLRQQTKEIHKVSSKVQKLIDDMIDTMYAYDGVGLAAPQVGESFKLFIIDVSDPKSPPNPMVFINPKIIKKTGAIDSQEGCLSFPNAYVHVRRYENVVARAKDEKGRTFTIEAKGGSLLARAIQHEFDHLEGILFIDHSRNRFEAEKELFEKGLPPIDANHLLEEEDLENVILDKEKQPSKQG